MNSLVLNQSDSTSLLTPDEYSQMLADISRVSLAAGISFLPEHPIHVSSSRACELKSPIERLALIESLLPGLTQAAVELQRNPIQKSLAKTRIIDPPIRARRVTAAAMLSAVRRGHFDRHWEDTVSQLTADTPENQAVKSFLGFLRSECREIGFLANSAGEGEVSDRVRVCIAAIQKLCADPWWQQITLRPEAWKKPPTQRALARHSHAQIFSDRDRYRRELVFDEAVPMMDLPPRELWQVYETWCLFQTLGALMALGYAAAGGAVIFRRKTDDLMERLIQGEASRVQLTSLSGRQLSLAYNQTFAQGERSLSHTMQPDITLYDFEANKIWILDAKFKAYAQPGDELGDINQMHAYRDAILGPCGQRCVEYAWCLFVGLTERTNSESITYGSKNGEVGALQLRPRIEHSSKALCALLASWLTAAPPPPVPPAFP